MKTSLKCAGIAVRILRTTAIGEQVKIMSCARDECQFDAGL